MDKEFQLKFLDEQIKIREDRINSLEEKKQELERIRKEIESLELTREKDENDLVELNLWKEQIKGE